MNEQYTPMQRVLTALSHKEPDRIPFLLGLTLHGAKETGLTIKDYFSHPDHVTAGQLQLQAKYQDDGVYGFYYAAAEILPWGGEIIFSEDGPPNSGRPPLLDLESILKLKAPSYRDAPVLMHTIETIRQLKHQLGETIPIFGVAISPFSLPVLQLGFDHYFDIMSERHDLFDRLMELNQAYCIEWANAQLEAGATAIVYFDPVSSPTIVPRIEYLRTGFQIAKKVIPQIKGAVAVHFASGNTFGIVNDVVDSGALVVGVSSKEDLAELKKVTAGRIGIIGNLNAIRMRRWTPAETEAEVKFAIASAGPGGGFVLSDNHGEIPWQVPDEVLFAIAENVRKWGQYPLTWIHQK